MCAMPLWVGFLGLNFMPFASLDNSKSKKEKFLEGMKKDYKIISNAIKLWIHLNVSFIMYYTIKYDVSNNISENGREFGGPWEYSHEMRKLCARRLKFRLNFDIHGYIPRASNCLVCYAIDGILSHPYKILGFSTNMLPISWSSSWILKG